MLKQGSIYKKNILTIQKLSQKKSNLQNIRNQKVVFQFYVQKELKSKKKVLISENVSNLGFGISRIIVYRNRNTFRVSKHSTMQKKDQNYTYFGKIDFIRG